MIGTQLSYNPNIAIHPGKSLKDELEFLSISQTELAQRAGLSEKHISQIINGQAPITPETAIKIERVIGTPAEFWHNLQKNYELTVARLKSEERMFHEIVETKKFFCYLELVNLGYVTPTRNWTVKAESLLKFFGVDSLLYIPDTQAFAFRQAKGKFDQRSLAAWLRCGDIESSKITVKPFNKSRVREIIPGLRSLTFHPEGFGKKAQNLCASAGVALVYVPYFKNTKVNGSSRWVGDKAVIQLNTKGSYSDSFWFTFFHELGHILDHGKETFLDYDGKTRDQKEKDADRFAADTLISPAKYNKLVSNRTLTLSQIKQFAQSEKISLSVVIGRLAHDHFISWSTIGHLRERLKIKAEQRIS